MGKYSDLVKNKSGGPVLVTGASSPIGRAVCLLLTGRGCRIAMLAGREEELRELAAEVHSRGGFALPLACDITNREQVKTVYERIERELGKIFIAFLFAAIGDSRIGQNADCEETEQVMRVNFLGAVYWLEHLLPYMQKENRGIITVISSLAFYRGFPGWGSYSAAKSALVSLFESYQMDFWGTNIAFIIARPYLFAREMTVLSAGERGRGWPSPEKAAERIIQGVEKGKCYIAFPWYIGFFVRMIGILPLSFYRLFCKIFKLGG